MTCLGYNKVKLVFSENYVLSVKNGKLVKCQIKDSKDLR